MSGHKMIFLASLAILGVLVGLVLVHPVVAGNGFSEVSGAHLLKTEHEYLIQLDILNQEGKEAGYTIKILLGDYSYSEEIAIPDGSKFTYVHHVPAGEAVRGKVYLGVYRAGDTIPLEQLTYYLN